ncbi:hypothetical protein SAMN03159444_02261 [Pseudomonas sp. NFACC02]|uniref:hypothetical protein n=1 Tax=Pseudomonas sp. NFACC02 TaxID=1566250 RepID=UPI0008C7F7F8|nr:hypothetical protein [Pseudomonas sp. NFACC02]SEQ70116.1 hypothetical protein SAMN03159444_02261 [Pseudomonas sp. NFACC02]
MGKLAMADENTHVVAAIDGISRLASAGAIFVFLAYIVGFIKTAIVYIRLDAAWVLDFHSFQDFAVQGFYPLLLSTAVGALWYLCGFKGGVLYRLVSVVGVIIMIANLIFAVLDAKGIYKVDQGKLITLGYSLFYVFSGCFFAAGIRIVHEGNARRSGAFAFVSGFIFICLLSDGLLGENSINRLKGTQGDASLAESKDGKLFILIGSVNGKYLLATCGEKMKFSMVEPSQDLEVNSREGRSCDIGL